jgi:hypothetical protein
MLTMREIPAGSTGSLHPSLRRITIASLPGSSTGRFGDQAVILDPPLSRDAETRLFRISGICTRA